MGYLGNAAHKPVVLQLEARKSFSLQLFLRDPNGRAADLTGCSLRIVAKSTPITSTETNLLEGDDVAVIEDPASGKAHFEIQALTLDLTPAEYAFAIVLINAEGYSSVLVKGVIDLQQNSEFESTLSSYEGVNASTGLIVTVGYHNSIDVNVGGILPPGMNWVRDDVLTVIENFDPESVALVPPGGTQGYVLTKVTGSDYSMDWRPVGNGEFALDATSIPAGHVPVAVGDDTWIWDAAGIDATGVAAGYVPISDGANGWAWDELLTTVDWNLTSGEPGSIINKPTLGSAAASNVADFVPSTALASELPGIHFVTEVPVSGTDGHLYFVYEV